ncbi:MAG TPA: DegV family protein [Anaerolineales bacterium]|jgi:DegV family protein with EDD domain
MKIVTDCAADLRAEELEEFGITQAPLYIHFPEGEVSAVDISADEFYNRLEAMRPAIPSTAQPSSGMFEQIYRSLAETSKNIFSIHISSGLSGTLNSAQVGGEQVKEQAEVSYWDTLTLSGGERFQVLAAALADKAGWTMEKIQERLTEIREHSEVIYTLETLEYLARGGRIGRVQALMGSLLKLKPVINVSHTDGKYSTVTKARTIPAALEALTDNLLSIYNKTPLWVNVLHGRFQQGADMLADMAEERLNVAKLETSRISPVLGVHTGPGIVGAAVVPMSLMEDLL